MVKVRVSYEKPEQLEALLKLLKPVVVRHKEKQGENGQYSRSYIDVKV